MSVARGEMDQAGGTDRDETKAFLVDAKMPLKVKGKEFCHGHGSNCRPLKKK